MEKIRAMLHALFKHLRAEDVLREHVAANVEATERVDRSTAELNDTRRRLDAALDDLADSDSDPIASMVHSARNSQFRRHIRDRKDD